MRVIDVAITLYGLVSSYGELGDIKNMLMPVIRSLFERAKEICK